MHYMHIFMDRMLAQVDQTWRNWNRRSELKLSQSILDTNINKQSTANLIHDQSERMDFKTKVYHQVQVHLIHVKKWTQATLKQMFTLSFRFTLNKDLPYSQTNLLMTRKMANSISFSKQNTKLSCFTNNINVQFLYKDSQAMASSHDVVSQTKVTWHH